MRSEYLLETQEIVCLGIVPRDNVGLTKRLSEGNTFSQCPVLNGGCEEGRRVDLLPQVETGISKQGERKPVAETHVERFQ